MTSMMECCFKNIVDKMMESPMNTDPILTRIRCFHFGQRNTTSMIENVLATCMEGQTFAESSTP